jgi:cob(I)alamin adenosyltransferase
LAGWKGNPLLSIEPHIKKMEHWIDQMEKSLPPLTNFILPGGSGLAAQIHIARSICRRVERQTVSLSKKQRLDPLTITYLNRLSDLLFTLARFINKKANSKETVWSGIPRKKII